MQLNDIVDVTFNRLFGRLLRRALGAALLAAFAVVALYYASGAGTLALAQTYGVLNAYLIMAAVYAVFALIVLTVLYATRVKPAAVAKLEGEAPSSPNMQIAALIEAVMLGYTMARKTRLP
jgi:hypothetical protein